MYPSEIPNGSGELPLRAEQLRPGLQTRILGRAGLSERLTLRTVHLERGRAVLRKPDGDLPIEAPALAWLPWQDGYRMEISPGSKGSHLLLGSAAIERALHHRPEAEPLRFMAQRPALLSLSQDDGAAQSVQSCLRGIIAETAQPGPLGAAVIDSLLHVLLILIYRGQPQALRAEARTSIIAATRLNALIEAHFREHWRVSRYAAALGVSRDRLNDICLRALDRPPGALIRARLHQEAKLYLENSTLSLDQIAALLGFSGTPQFHRFFKTLEGTTPGRFRSALRRPDANRETLAAPYQWP